MKPTVGRIVHYTSSDGAVRPAMVVATNDDGTCNLQVFRDGANDDRDPDLTDDALDAGLTWKTSIPEGEPGMRGKWTWPSREPATDPAPPPESEEAVPASAVPASAVPATDDEPYA